MNKIHNTLVAAGFLCGFAAPAQAVLIDFDTDAMGVPIVSEAVIAEQYAALGVHFSALENGSPVDVYTKTSLDGNTSPSSPNQWSNCGLAGPTSCGGFRADILRILFDFDVNNVSWMADSLGSLGADYQAYDAGNNLLESVIAANTSQFDPFSFTASGIRRIDIVQPDDSWGHVLDNLSFTQQVQVQVPEPASLALLGIGLAGLGAMRRRKTV